MSYKIFSNNYLVDGEDLMDYRNNLKSTVSIISDKLITNPSAEIISPLATENDVASGQRTIAPDLAVVLATDNIGNPIYDVNNDGYINIEDLTILGSVVDNPEEFDYEIKYGIWYKRFRIENVQEDRIIRIMGYLKVIYYLTEKEDMSELKDYLVLWQKGYVSNDFNISTDELKRV